MAVLDPLRQDLRLGVRLLVRAPALSVTVVTTLALGIGAVCAAFAVVDAVLLRPLPYADANRLAVVMHRVDEPVSAANFLDWKRQASVFSAMGAAEYWTPSLTGAGVPEKVYALHVTPDLLSMLGVAPAMGELLRPGAGALSEVVIGHGLWQRRFGADPAIVGRELLLDGAVHRIVGVMPPEFAFAPFWATRAELWAPLDLTARASQRGAQTLRVFARLAPNVGLVRARETMQAVTTRLESEFPGTNRNVTVTPLKDLVIGDVRGSIVIVFAAVWLVLLIACGNAAHLLLARSSARETEVAVRAALGAGRSRLVRQLLTESLVLAACGGAAGVLAAHWTIALVRALGATIVPRVQTVAMDERVLIVALILSVATALLCGLAPALKLTRPDLAASMRNSGRTVSLSPRSRHARAALIASEVALAVILLVAAGLLMRSFAVLRSVDPGFNPDRLLSLMVSVTGTAEAAPDRRLAFYQRLVDDIGSLPGVARVSAINHVPLVGDLWGMPIVVEGRPTAAPGDELTATFRAVLPRYFETMGQRLVSGRDVTGADRAGATPVAIVNAALAAATWPGEDPIGKRIKVLFEPDPEWRTIVGVAAHAVRGSWRDRQAPEVYVPLLQSAPHRASDRPHWGSLSYVIRTTGEAPPIAAIRSAIERAAPAVPVSDIAMMSDVARDATRGDRFLTALLGGCAGLALALAALGIYGIMSFVVAGRRRELGIRVALGAPPARLMSLVLRQGLTAVAAGTAVGVTGAWLTSGAMAGLLYGISPMDAPTLAGAVLLLGAAAALACYLPARRASAIDPVDELR